MARTKRKSEPSVSKPPPTLELKTESGEVVKVKRIDARVFTVQRDTVAYRDAVYLVEHPTYVEVTR